jgi:hypothetical protein
VEELDHFAKRVTDGRAGFAKVDGVDLVDGSGRRVGGAHWKEVNWAGCLVSFFSNVVLGDGFG